MWLFHGGRDPVVSIENSETMVRTLRECGGSPRFTVYPEASHDSWTAAYDDPELYAWLAEQTLNRQARKGTFQAQAGHSAER